MNAVDEYQVRRSGADIAFKMGSKARQWRHHWTCSAWLSQYQRHDLKAGTSGPSSSMQSAHLRGVAFE